MSINSFMRKEKKYRIDKIQYDELLMVLNQKMHLDKFCKNGAYYSIRNIYFDTPDNHLIRMSTLKPYYKAKLRVRKYGTLEENRNEYFLEIKRKIGGIVYKRRLQLTKNELDLLLNHGFEPDCENYVEKQISKEIKYFLSVYKVCPALFLAYKRLAYFDKLDKRFRVTFDSSIITRRHNIDLDLDVNGEELLEPGTYIMEVKINGAVPIWFADELSRLKIYPMSFSKYGKEYEKKVKKEDMVYV